MPLNRMTKYRIPTHATVVAAHLAKMPLYRSLTVHKGLPFLCSVTLNGRKCTAWSEEYMSPWSRTHYIPEVKQIQESLVYNTRYMFEDVPDT